MSFNDLRPPVMPPLSYGGGGDASGFWPPFQMNDQIDLSSQFEHQPLKRPRSSEENQSNPGPYHQPMSSRSPQPNASVNKGTSNIFFKTRMCAKFKVGLCRNGENCNFAHGIEDIRHPPPNWQEIVGLREEDQSSGNWNDDQKIIQKMKLCRKFYNGEECPYGDRCNFLHEDPAKFRDDSGRFRESSAISIGTTGTPVMNGSGSSFSEGNKPVNNNSDTLRVNVVKPTYWKTKICSKWEITGQCPFGDKCHFAHGHTELQAANGREGEVLNSTSVLSKPPVMFANEASSPSKVDVMPTPNEEVQSKPCLLKWKGPKKINRIYADWLDDVPLAQDLPS